jgi:hypothetical protein
MSRFKRELANKCRRGRAVGNLYVVTQRPIGNSGIIASFDTEEEREAFIECAERSDFATTGLIFPSIE